MALPPAAHRLVQLQGEQAEHHGRNDEDEERHSPAEPIREETGQDRPDDSPDCIGCAMEAVHVGAGLDGVVVGDQRVVVRVDERLAERRAAAHDGQEDEPRGQTGEPRERGKEHGPEDHQRNPLGAVRPLGDRDLQRQCGDGGQGNDRQRRRQVDAEALLDVREHDAERRSVEFVDGVQSEQHDQRERRLTTADRPQPHHRVSDAELESPPHRRVVDRRRWLLVAFCGRWCRHG